jgi:predicted secreted protein
LRRVTRLARTTRNRPTFSFKPGPAAADIEAEEYAMKKRSLLAAVAALAAAVPAFAGDVATFVNLGFSPDSAYFMFGQYGVDQAAGTPYAETYLVDSKKNDFVKNGVARKSFDARLEPGQDASGAFYALFAEQSALARKYKIDYLKPGRLLYILMDGQEPPATLSFRDFKTGASYEVALSQKAAEAAGSVSSSFGLAVTVAAKDGATRRVVGGNPDIKRPDVKAYVIRRIIAAPDERTLVFIVEKRMQSRGDSAVRYMIEALKLP